MLITSGLKQHCRRNRPNWKGLHRKELSEKNIWLFKERQQRELSILNMVDTILVEKLPEPKRAWDSWNEDRKTAYLDRKLYDINTVDFDRQQKRAYHKSKRAVWSGDRKSAWKEAWKTKTARWNRKKGQPDAPAPRFADK